MLQNLKTATFTTLVILAFITFWWFLHTHTSCGLPYLLLGQFGIVCDESIPL